MGWESRGRSLLSVLLGETVIGVETLFEGVVVVVFVEVVSVVVVVEVVFVVVVVVVHFLLSVGKPKGATKC